MSPCICCSIPICIFKTFSQEIIKYLWNIDPALCQLSWVMDYWSKISHFFLSLGSEELCNSSSCAVVLVCARHKGNCAEAEFNISLTQQPPCLPVCTSLSSLFGKSKHQGHLAPSVGNFSFIAPSSQAVGNGFPLWLFGELLVTISINMEDLKKACKELKMWLSKSLIWASGAKKCYRINRKIPFAKSPKKNYFLDPKKKKKFCSWIPKEGYFLLTPQRKGLDINLHSRADACTGWKSANRTATKKAFFSTKSFSPEILTYRL